MPEMNGSERTTKPRAIELFAGVGGFRYGLRDTWDVVWSNQWEPSTKLQHASNIYVQNFGDDGHVCQDIDDVLKNIRSEETAIPPHDLLVGGFPCQDYSVARTLSHATGLIGKKGVLWWAIHELLSRYLPRLILLENVDRLLKSPADQRGRDFAIILSSLASLGYRVQWRVVNAADYGLPQRRRRVFIVGELTGTRLEEPANLIFKDGILARALPVIQPDIDIFGQVPVPYFDIDDSLENLSEEFGIGTKVSRFRNAGVMQGFQVHTIDVTANFTGSISTLGEILQSPEDVAEELYIPDQQIHEWKYLKGAKKEPRTHRGSGTPYVYAEGAVAFPDPLGKPSRTILTGEGGPSPSRFKHVVETPDGRLRRLTPVEMERLNGFPSDWTKGIPDSRRAFMMGNALMVGIVEKIGYELH